MRRVAVFSYGLACYLLFGGVFLYAVGFLGNFGVPKSIDSPSAGHWAPALLINALLVGLFVLQHSVMARPGFKRWWTRLVREPIERSTYVLMTNLALILLFWQWRPMGAIVWDVEHPVAIVVLGALCALGWLGVLVTTFLINHFDLFGLRQVWLYLRGKPYTPLEFTTPGPYRYVRHPLYVGWMTAFWATPTMTVAHLVFAVATTAYMLFALRLEERDLLAAFGARYAEYRRRVPMLVPQTSLAGSWGKGAIAAADSQGG